MGGAKLKPKVWSNCVVYCELSGRKVVSAPTRSIKVASHAINTKSRKRFTYDAAIIGGGVVGLSIARELSVRGCITVIMYISRLSIVIFSSTLTANR